MAEASHRPQQAEQPADADIPKPSVERPESITESEDGEFQDFPIAQNQPVSPAAPQQTWRAHPSLRSSQQLTPDRGVLSDSPSQRTLRGSLSRRGNSREAEEGDLGEGFWSNSTTPQHHESPFAARRPSRKDRTRPPPSHLNRTYLYDNNGNLIATPQKTEDPFLDSRPASRRRFDEEMGYGGEPSPYQFGHGQSSPTQQPRLDLKNLSPEERREVLRLPWTQWMNSDFKNHFVAAMGEFVGTTMFLFFAFAGTTVANIQSNASSENTTTGESTGFNVGVLLYISVCFGFSLMVNVWVFFRISGGLFNPAVTLGLFLVRALTASRAVILCFSQICGGIAASAMVRFLLPETFNVRTTLGGGASIVQGVFIEAILTAELVFTIFMLAKEKHRATFIAPVGIGLALFIAELVGVQFTGGSLNPARSFGPCVVTAIFDQEHWIYWIGPFIGALIAVVFYKFIKILEYEMANPGADGDPTNDPTVNPEKMAEVTLTRRPTSNVNLKRAMDAHRSSV